MTAEDWLKPNIVLEAFEARAARMSVACAQALGKFANPEEGTSFTIALEHKSFNNEKICMCL